MQNILTEYNEVNCVDKKLGAVQFISSRRQSSRTRLVRLHSACTMARSATNSKEFTITNFPKRDEVQK